VAKVPQHPDLDRLESTVPQWHAVEPGELLWRVYFRSGEHPSRWHQFRTFGPTDARFDHHLEGSQAQRARSCTWRRIP